MKRIETKIIAWEKLEIWDIVCIKDEKAYKCLTPNLYLMTRQEMLDAINMKMAQVKHSDYGTSYFLPVMLWNCDKLIEKWPNYFDEWNVILDLWIKKDEPLDKQSDELIKYIFDLLK